MEIVFFFIFLFYSKAKGAWDIPYKCIAVHWLEKENIEKKDRYIDSIEGGANRECGFTLYLNTEISKHSGKIFPGKSFRNRAVLVRNEFSL